MQRATFSPQAEKDLDEIADFIAADDLETARRFVILLKEKCFRLASTPRIGREHKELSPDTFFFPAGNYMIAYLITDYGIHVVRVIHAARDFPRLF